MSVRTGICPVIVGPTAVGKTELITRLAARLPLEVISLDTRQIYAGLRIGTAQPTPAEQAICPHHLIDFVNPSQKYNAIRFRRDFCRVHGDITARGGAPILVGGAGMYLTALREGFLKIPGHTPERLVQVRSELEGLGDTEIRSRLRAHDPAAHARIHPNDRYRSQRALEIFFISGVTMTELSARDKDDPALGLEFPTFVLERAVEELDARIAARTSAMLDSGWIAETEAAVAQYSPDCPGLQSIGYREIIGWLEGRLRLEDLPAAIVLATRQYAKRQRTMFRHVPAIGHWSPEDPQLLSAILDAGGPSEEWHPNT